jgi:radical SAM protein with 4Fe4S-binding SPASM domain
MRKAVVFGIGKRYEHFKNIIADEYVIVALSDNDVNKQNLIIDDVPVVSPCSVLELEFDVILITLKGKALADVTEQLEQIGIPSSKIKPYDKTLSPFVIDAQFFNTKLTSEQKMAIFKDNVEIIYFELSSQCNRRCWICPNSVVDRHSQMKKLDSKVYHKILEQLRSIEYSGDITFSLYNEPLMDAELESKIQACKEYLPGASLHFNTNGDYLDIKRVEKLEKAGLDYIGISLYEDKADKPFEYSKAVEMIKNCAARIGVLIESDTISPQNEIMVTALAYYKSLPLVFRCGNHRVIANDRCGALPESAPVVRIEKPTRICDCLFNSFSISYNGDIVPCPNFHNDVETQKKYIVGNACETSVFDLFVNTHMTQFRRLHVGDIASTPCYTCGMLTEHWVNNGITVLQFLPFRDRPRYRRNS